VREQEQIKQYAQLAHLYFTEGTFSKEEVYSWMKENGLTVTKLLKGRISFTYTDDWYSTIMTVYKSGKVDVETGFDDNQ
jgi:hypothetical protein